MKRLIFINDHYQMNKKELNKFIYCLKEDELLEKHLPYLTKKVMIDELLSCLKDNKNVFRQQNIINYKNKFTGEVTRIVFSFNDIFFESNVNESSLEKYFYRLCDNFIFLNINN